MTAPSNPMEAFEKALDALLLGYSEAVEARYHAARSAVLTLYREALEDARRLDWLARSGAMVAYSQDGDDCHLHWPYNPSDEEAHPVNQQGTFSSFRAAIDAATAPHTGESNAE